MAKADYAELLKKWRITQADETQVDPSNDCLAFSRFFFCSYYFKRCDETKNPLEQPLCSYVCDIYLLRCPKEEYTKFCGLTSTELTCSLSQKGWRSFLGFIGVLMVLAFVAY